MMNKQLLWGWGSVKHVFMSFLLLTIFFSIKSAERTYQSLKDQELGISTDIVNNFETKSFKSTKISNYFHGKSYEELNLVFEHAPWKAKEIVDHLKDPDALGEPEYRAALFVGPPGGGKTSTAIAIALRAQCGCKFIRCSELQKSYRNRASEELLDQLNIVKKYVGEGEKIVVIADELGLLLKKPNDNRRDNDATSGTLQGFLDDMEGEDNFFFIGTLNDDTDMTESMKDRMELDRIEFPPLSAELRREIFRTKFETPRMQFHEECDDKFIDNIVVKLYGCSPRSYKNMRKELSKIFYHEEPNVKKHCIRKKHIVKLTEALLQARKSQKRGVEDETEMQQQERQWKEGLRANLLSLYINHAQETVSIQGGYNIGTQGVNVNVGTSVSQTNSFRVTKESVNFIWKQACPHDPDLEFPEIKISEKSSKKTEPNKYEMLESFLQAGLTTGALGGGVIAGPPGAFVGAVIGGGAAITAYATGNDLLCTIQ